MDLPPITIPGWTDGGILPAADPDDPTSRARSPYIVSLAALIARFGFTEERRRLLSGLLDFRAELHRAGLLQGFQWINGSFVERIEDTADRPPNDVDLVTFFHIPEGETIQSLWLSNQDLFDPQIVKARHQTDAYFAPFNPQAPNDIVKQTIYWYSLWSHDRNGLWKGFLEVDLSQAEDLQAKRILDSYIESGGEP